MLRVAVPSGAAMPFVIEIRNLRALQHFSLAPPVGLSCLAGPNGSGKTTFLLALKMLRHAVEREDLGIATLNTLGLFRLRHARALGDEPVEISVSVDSVRWTIQVIERAGAIEPLAPETVSVGDKIILRRSAGSRTVWHRGSELPPAEDDRVALRHALEKTGDDDLQALRTWFNALSVFHDLDLYSLRTNGSRVGMDRHLHSRGR